MKKILPVFAIVLLLTSMKFNTSIARLLENSSLETELTDLNSGISELKVSVFPNPVINNRINITANREMKSIKILTIVGSVVFEEEYENGILSIQLDLDKLNKGLYLLKIDFGNENSYSEKIMVK